MPSAQGPRAGARRSPSPPIGAQCARGFARPMGSARISAGTVP
jgi:hypothetical protein